MQSNGSGGKTIAHTYKVNDPTEDPVGGDKIVGVINENTTEYITWRTDQTYDSKYTYLLWFQRAPLGSIGVDEVSISAMETQIAGWQRKIDATTDAERIAAYNANIDELNDKMAATYGNASNPGLHRKYYRLCHNAILLTTSETVIATR